MLVPGESRQRLAQRLKAAYADGLLSDETFDHRLDHALSPGLIDARRLIGDLSFRRPTRPLSTLTGWLVPRMTRWLAGNHGEECPLLALDWSGATSELLIGRHDRCDVLLTGESVSRRHARAVFRDGEWVLQDLDSTNGTLVNGVRIGRCRLQPGDRIRLGAEEIQID